MKEIFCEIRANNRHDDVYCVYTDGTLDLFSPFPAGLAPGKLRFVGTRAKDA